MFRAFFSIPLILQLLVSPGWCFVHYHPQHSAEESQQHAARPHLHVSDHDHDHHHEPAPQQEPGRAARTPTPDVSAALTPNAAFAPHDSTAVYFASDVVWAISSSMRPDVSKTGTALCQLDLPLTLASCSPCEPLRFPAAKSTHESCPVYLRHLSLRL